MVDRRASAYRALSSDKRVSMLHLLQRHGAPMTVEDLAARVGLHVNTVREHLDRLIESGFVESEPEVRRTRGRPRMLYRTVERAAAVTTDAWAREQLVRVLVQGYGRRLSSASSAAEDAGRAWGAALSAAPGDLDEGPASPDDVAPVGEGPLPEHSQLAALEAHFEDLGFEPEADTEQLEVHLNRCPFVDLARERPEVVCSVHLGISRGVLAQQGGPLQADRLEPFVGPQHCVLHLTRCAPPEALACDPYHTAAGFNTVVRASTA